MAETTKLGLPLVAPAQAQKHVTVNESFMRLDALTQLALTTVGTTVPPSSPDEGEVHAIGASASGLWSGHDSELSIFQNGGWAFVTPVTGWRGWSIATGNAITFDGEGWIEGAGALSANGAGFVHRSLEIDHVVGVGASSSLSGALLANTIVYGITGRVLSDIGGVSGIEIGVSGSANRYGGGIGTAAGAWARSITSSPLAYYSNTDLVLSANGGAFDGTGSIRLAVHFAELTLPRA